MDGVRVAPGPGIPRGLIVAEREITEQFSHASGPGGQGVNTADSRVQLTVDLAAVAALDDTQRALVLRRLQPRLSGTVLTVSAEEHRSQLRNRAAARARLAEILREALTPEIPRRATRPTRGSQHRRLAAKRQRSETKRNRQSPGAD